MEGKKIKGKSFRKFGYTSQGWLLFGNSGKCSNSSIGYWKLPKIQTGRLVRMESAQLFTIILRPDRDRLCFTDGKRYL